MNLPHAGLYVTGTLTPALNVHRGAPLLAARVIVILVPTTALLVFWWLRTKRGR